MNIEPDKPTMGLRLIAIFEVAKGMIGLGVGFGLIAIAGHHVPLFIKSIVRQSHLIETGHTPHFILEMIRHPENSRLVLWTILAVLYSGLRFTEAYGLWQARRWGEWLALISVGLYVPFEIYALAHGVSLLKVSVLLLNLIFVAYLAAVLRATRRKRAMGFAASAAAPAAWNSNVTQG